MPQTNKNGPVELISVSSFDSCTESSLPKKQETYDINLPIFTIVFVSPIFNIKISALLFYV